MYENQPKPDKYDDNRLDKRAPNTRQSKNQPQNHIDPEKQILLCQDSFCQQSTRGKPCRS